MKNFFITLAVMLLCVPSLFAQKDDIAYRMNEAWYVSAGIGGNLTVLGFSDGKLSVGGIATELDISAGKWIKSYVGVRVGYSGLAYDNNFGSDEVNKFGFFHGDLMLDPFSFFRGYDSERFYTPQPYVTFGVINCYDNKATDFMAGVGLFNSFRLSDRFDANLDLRAVTYKNNYLQILGSYTLDLAFSGTIGITYKFNRGDSYVDSSVPGATYSSAVRPGRSRNASTAASQAQEIEDLKKQIASANEETRKAKEEAKPARPAQAPAQASAPAQAVYSDGTEPIESVVIFEIGSSEISESSKVIIGFWAKSINANPNRTYTLTGYADNLTGSSAKNEKISKARAEAVAKVLVNTYGVKESQLKVDYVGGKAPMVGEIPASSRAVILK